MFISKKDLAYFVQRQREEAAAEEKKRAEICETEKVGLEKENRKLKAENSQLRNDLIELNNKYDKLREQYEHIMKKNPELKKVIEQREKLPSVPMTKDKILSNDNKSSSETLFSDEELLSLKKEVQKREDEKEAAACLLNEQKERFYQQIRTAIDIFCEMARMLPKTYSSIGAPGNKKFLEKIDYIIKNGACVKADDDIVLWMIPNFGFLTNHFDNSTYTSDDELLNLLRMFDKDSKYSGKVTEQPHYKVRSHEPIEVLTISNDLNYYWVNQFCEISRHGEWIGGKAVAVQADNLAEGLFQLYCAPRNEVVDSINYVEKIFDREEYNYFRAFIIKASFVCKSYEEKRVIFDLEKPLSRTEMQAMIIEDLKNAITKERYFDYDNYFKNCIKPINGKS